jgi:hypothetical protein
MTESIKGRIAGTKYILLFFLLHAISFAPSTTAVKQAEVKAVCGYI